MHVDLSQVSLQVWTPDKCLVLAQEERRTATMELVARDKRLAERQVVKVGDVDSVRGAFGADLVCR